MRNVILTKVGAAVVITVDTSQRRQGLKVHFEEYTKSEGPNFLIRPKGLKKHLVELSFGNYSKQCITRIENHAEEEQYAVARALLHKVAKKHEVKFNDSSSIENWRVSASSTISITVSGISGQHDEDSIESTTKHVMVPLIAAVAELMGFEDVTTEEGEIEGQIKLTVIKRRERSARNRLLALTIHGTQCKGCGEEPMLRHGEIFGNIIEIHHVEPLCELGEPRAYDPAIDLIPLCPTCHRITHKKKPALTLEELKTVLSNDAA